jgi:hypothetical protein
LKRCPVEQGEISGEAGRAGGVTAVDIPELFSDLAILLFRERASPRFTGTAAEEKECDKQTRDNGVKSAAVRV